MRINYCEDVMSSNYLPYVIQFRKDSSFFMLFENFVSFVKGCESFIRRTNDYSNYISELKSLGLTNCQVLGNISSEFSEPGNEVTVEMHHGPIFTLFDYCGCIINHLIKNDEDVTTMRVAKIVMNEHWEGNIQTVFLSKTVHQAVDSGKLFISLKQAYGNLNGFLKKYSDGLTEYQINKINEYISLSKKMKSTDNGLFDIQDTIKEWHYRRLKHE